MASENMENLVNRRYEHGFVTGANGGYQLARDARDISAADVIDALEGPVSITECSGSDSRCEHEGVCSVGGAWRRVNVAIRRALDDVSLSDLLLSNRPVPRIRFAGLPISVEKKAVAKKPAQRTGQ